MVKNKDRSWECFLKYELEFLDIYGKWIHGTRGIYNGRRWRQTACFADGSKQIKYFICQLNEHIFNQQHKHMLDGPSEIWFDKEFKIKKELWHVNNICLKNFCYKKSDSEVYFFQYINDNPEFIKEIEILVRHNHWLTEEQLLLLNTIIVMK